MSSDKNVKVGYQSLGFFCTSILIFSCVYLTDIYLGFPPNVWSTNFWSPILYLSVILIFLKICLSGFLYDVSVRSTFLGYVFATGLYLSYSNNGYKIFGIYIAIMALFHFTEFLATALTNPHTLTLDSFILNHSLQYGIAAVSSWLEWAIELYFFPEMKSFFIISYLGLAMCISGELLRKGAMMTAKTNFNHCVQSVKSTDHTLVTHGLYSYFRHPSYVGWFYWSIGTQIILLNPVCLVGYTAASWLFFRERVFYEEYTLLTFFNDSYLKYQQSVPTGLPFIKGYAI